MSVASKLQTLAQNLTSVLSQINSKLNAKGVDSASTLTDVSSKIEAIDIGINPTGTIELSTNAIHNVKNYEFAEVTVPVGLDTSDATATAADMADGKTGYVQGVKVTGSVPEKNDTHLSVSANTVTVPAGIYRSQTTKSVPTVSKATPHLSFNTSTGIFSVSISQEAGYVSADATPRTQQYELSTRGAQNITPGINPTTILAGKYLTGNQVIAGDQNLLPQNIKEGVTIFGVQGELATDNRLRLTDKYDLTDYGFISNNTVSITLPVISGRTVRGVLLVGDTSLNDVYEISSFFGIDGYSVQTRGSNVQVDDEGNYFTLENGECTMDAYGLFQFGSASHYKFILLTD